MSKVIRKEVMPIIAVPSVDEARSFYVEQLAFGHVMGIVGKDGQFDFCTVVKDGARVMFMRAGSETNGKKQATAKQPVEIYLEVSDVQNYHDVLKKEGIRIADPLTMQWWGDKTFKVRDPNGYELWFYETLGEPMPPEGAKIV